MTEIWPIFQKIRKIHDFFIRLFTLLALYCTHSPVVYAQDGGVNEQGQSFHLTKFVKPAPDPRPHVQGILRQGGYFGEGRYGDLDRLINELRRRDGVMGLHDVKFRFMGGAIEGRIPHDFPINLGDNLGDTIIYRHIESRLAFLARGKNNRDFMDEDGNLRSDLEIVGVFFSDNIQTMACPEEFIDEKSDFRPRGSRGIGPPAVGWPNCFIKTAEVYNRWRTGLAARARMIGGQN